MHVCSTSGILNTRLSQSAFVDCATAKRPQNTLFLELNDPQNIVLDDLENYLDLVKGLFEHTPTGPLLANYIAYLFE